VTLKNLVEIYKGIKSILDMCLGTKNDTWSDVAREPKERAAEIAGRIQATIKQVEGDELLRVHALHPLHRQ